MDQNQLLSSAIEIALSLLEKNGSFLPFCKAVDQAGEAFVYSAASDSAFSAAQAYESILLNVKRDLESRRLVGAAFCFDSRVRLSEATAKVPAVEVEVHHRGSPASVYYCLYRLEQNKATVLEYYTNPAKENLFDET